MFTGFTHETFEFFMAIEFNNNLEFFNENKSSYENYVKLPLQEMAKDLAICTSTIDDNFETRPTKTVSRIRRDTRFSKNKSPYRDYMWIGFTHQGIPKEESLALYFDISYRGIGYGLGMHGQNKPWMDALRRRISANPQEFLSIISEHNFAANFTLKGEEYKRIILPDGLPQELVPWYIKKGLYLEHARPIDKTVMSHDIVDEVISGFHLLKPIYQYLQTTFGGVL